MIPYHLAHQGLIGVTCGVSYWLNPVNLRHARGFIRYEREAPSPSEESRKTIDDCASRISPESRHLSEWHDAYVRNSKSRIAFDLDIAKEHVPPNAGLLEIGSIPLLFTAALSRSNFRVIGCDIAPERYATTINKLRMNVVKCDIETEKLPFESDTFDAVVFNELFEHLRINPIFTLSEVRRVAKPGATLLLSTPNLRSLAGIINFLIRNRAYSCEGNIYAQYQKLEGLGHMGHVREYTAKEIIEFLEDVGFSVTKVIYRGRLTTALERIVTGVFAGLSPFVSYIASKRN